MLEIKKIKTENGEIGISFVIQTSNIKQKYSDVISVFSNTKERIEQRLRLFRLALQILCADPNEISLEKNGRENQLSFAWKDDSKRRIKGVKNFWCIDNSRIVTLDEMKGLFQNSSHSLEIFRGKFFKTIKKAHLVIQNNKKKIVKVATSVSAVALIVCASAVLMPFINAGGNKLCDVSNVATDVVLVMDTTESMQSVCTYSETCDLNWHSVEHKGDEVTQEWCDELCETNNNNPNDDCEYYYCECEYDSKIDDAKTAAKLFVGELGTDDQSALVSFNTAASLDPILSNNHSATQTEIDKLTTATTDATNIGDAIDAANIELTASNSQAVKAIILLTDGKANKPNGNGYGENPLDVAYAELKAQEAVVFGYKIFTIGLGSKSDINETMLQSIATQKSNGEPGYYYAATGSDLAGIYEQIANEICAYGSISGCKYLDADADGELTESEKDVAMPDWQIRLFDGSATTTQRTDATGCYTFAGLLAGEYTISEILKDGWQQTYPAENIWTFDLAEGQATTTIHFGNYFPCDDGNVCTDDSYDLVESECVFTPNSAQCDDEVACTFDDTCSDGSCSGTPIVCDDEDLCTTDACVDGECVYTPIVCDDEDLCTTDACVDGECVYTPMNCDDGIKCTEDTCVNGNCQHDTSACTCNVDADCDDSNPCTDNICDLETYACGEPIDNANQCDDGDACTIDDICSDGACSGTPMNCDDEDLCTTDACVDGECVYTPIVCDDGIECTEDSCVEGVCQYDDSNCTTDPEPTPPSGGGAVMIPHSILDVRPIDIVGDSVTITWRTSFFATSQVIYSIEGETHEFDPDNPLMYGYARMTPEQDTNPKVTYHTVVIPELSPEQTYYYRTISRASPAIFSNEFTFTTLASLEEDDASETDETQEQESATEKNSSDEFVSDESAASEELSLEEMEEKLNEISNKVATIGQEVAKISPKVNVPAFASADSNTENLAYNDLDSKTGDEEPLFADATTDEASFAEGTTNKVNNEINDESDDSKFLAGIGTFFSNLEGWRLALIFLLGIILALIILRLIKSLVGGNKNK